MSASQIPHPVPYQGSKRRLCAAISSFVPSHVQTLYEPFAGSAAFTLYAARHNLAEHFVLGDALTPLIDLWRLIVNAPDKTAAAYQHIWEGQNDGDAAYYYRIRDQYNTERDPVLLLYLIARCVKNAVRFSKVGNFTQSVDKRRKGMHPDKMRRAICGASALLAGKVTFFAGDFEECMRDAAPHDLMYLDPPYQGTTYGRDKRYYQQLEMQRLCDVLRDLNEREIPFLLSYDGKNGEKEYGQRLPDELDLQHTLIKTGRSSQATLNGRNSVTFEGLYLSPNLHSPDLPETLSLLPEQLPLTL